MLEPYYYSFLFAAVATAFNAVYLSKRYRESRAAASIFWVMIFFILWCMSYYLEYALPVPEWKFFAVRCRPLFVYISLTLSILLGLRFGTRNIRVGKITIVALYIIPVIIATFSFAGTDSELFTYNFHVVKLSESVSVAQYECGPLYRLYEGYSALGVTVFTAILATSLLRAERAARFTGLSMFLAVPFPAIVDYLYLKGYSLIPSLNISGFLYATAQIYVFYTLKRFDFYRDVLVPIERDEAFEYTSESMLILDERNRIVDINSAAVERFGVRRNCIGHTVEQIFDWWPGVSDMFTARESLSRDVTLTTGMREKIFVLSVSPVMGRLGRLAGRFAVFHDITEQELAKRSAEEANRAKSMFLANISHEIRTPMNAILNLAEFLLESPLGPDQKKFTEGIHGSAEALLGILNDMLDLSKIETGKMLLESHPFSLSDIVQQTVWLLSARAAENGTSIITEYGTDVPRWLSGDSIKVRQILLNLLSNAVKFTEQGSIYVRIERGIHDGDAGTVIIEVADTGIGMDEETQHKVFEKFFQAASPVSGGTGTGLGLAITKELVEMMGGVISVSSRPGAGTVFRVALPLAECCDEMSVSGDVPAESGEHVFLPGARVLIVEDIEMNRFIATRILRSIGCTVTAASNGVEAVALAEQMKYDLIFMDCRMPEMNGLEATRLIRGSACPNRETPVVALSAGAYEANRTECIGAGMDNFLMKPFTRAQLTGIAAKYCLPRHVNDSLAAAPCPPAVSQTVFDRQAALELAGNEDFLDEILGIFVSRSPDTITKLQAACDCGNTGEIVRLAHSLKGMLAQIFAGPAKNAALGLETIAMENRMDDIPHALSLLIDSIHGLIQAINSPID